MDEVLTLAEVIPLVVIGMLQMEVRLVRIRFIGGLVSVAGLRRIKKAIILVGQEQEDDSEGVFKTLQTVIRFTHGVRYLCMEPKLTFTVLG